MQVSRGTMRGGSLSKVVLVAKHRGFHELRLKSSLLLAWDGMSDGSFFYLEANSPSIFIVKRFGGSRDTTAIGEFIISKSVYGPNSDGGGCA